ncbi:hypothetical protein M1L60_06375 [Actinoplanes sp. TRM 88003]|uniref:Uncharacterized protein n=1 Tax=Paractinoplanes aksuensis TaxID=2939490 RepID=A0ABT1DHA0_9ACTN|nr:hypothetical protein [Actinoplanes aksuensis]MCO8270218.1 hypothetical protein [Actinoplanes aksuensis]
MAAVADCCGIDGSDLFEQVIDFRQGLLLGLAVLVPPNETPCTSSSNIGTPLDISAAF